MSGTTDPLWDHPLARAWLRVRAFDRARPQLLDSLIAAFVLLIGVAGLFRGEHDDLFGMRSVPVWVIPVTAAAQAVPLVWRRRASLRVFAVVLLVCAVQWSLGVALRSDLSLMIALYGVARYAPPRRLPVVAAAVLPVAAVLAFRVEPLTRQPWVSLFFVACAVTAASALGLAGRIRQAQLAALADRAATLEIERGQREKLATATERARVSREMHDIVGHSLAVIIGLADGGAAQAELRPERGPEVLRIIAETGRESLGELRRTLGALRADLPDGDGEAGGGEVLHPQPGTAQIAALCERIRAAGPTVGYTTSGDTASLTAGVQLAVHRIVQEALTNSLKHAGPATDIHVAVAVDGRAGEVRVRVDDSGPESSGGPAPRAETVWLESARSESARPQSARLESARLESARLESARESSDLPRTGAGPAVGATTPAIPQAAAQLSQLPGHGQGLIGIRERAALVGGSATAGPRPGGGWTVRAVLPTRLDDEDNPQERP
ncbi:sensor histidine kinase [Streptacidiphilus sp. MAP5-3]|uniref:sensor histidine kinase n=1 Tax=unclassified Streptacidiphilus TaxID=2643834 RepID=UPI003514B776